ncbi:MAG TPA: hypothetical protein VHU83_11810 [Bryobacteraceae bacterium]|nr:hypothetical protein [Bryobacteraceae bacterium]
MYQVSADIGSVIYASYDTDLRSVSSPVPLGAYAEFLGDSSRRGIENVNRKFCTI